MVGEVLPLQAFDSNFWNENGGTAGTTIPINWNSNSVPTTDPGCGSAGMQAPTSPLGCRFSLAAKGFKSKHPGGANFLFARWLREVPQGQPQHGNLLPLSGVATAAK